MFLETDFLASSTLSLVISIGKQEWVGAQVGWDWFLEASTGYGAGCGNLSTREKQEGLPSIIPVYLVSFRS